MTIKRATIYIGGATLLAAWFSSAASLSLQPEPPRGLAPVLDSVVQGEHLAGEVQEQAKRLKARLATAPPRPTRNPFAFGTAHTPRPQVGTAGPLVEPEPIPAPPPEPVLSLIGIAEQRRPEGLLRTAMLVGAADDLLVVAVGDAVLGRYTVSAISSDSIELADPDTGQVRRLSIQ